MLRAYGFRIAMFALVGLLVGLVVSMVMPKKYEAVIQIMVDQRQKQAIATGSPAADSVSDLVDSTAPRTVQTQVEQLTGYGVISAAARRVAESRGVSPESLPGFDIMNLMRSVTVEAATESDAITLHVRLADKALAQDLAAEIYNAFMEQNQEKSEAVGRQATNFLKTQMTTINRQVADVDNQMLALQKQFNAPNIELQIQADIQALKNAEEIMDQARSEQAAAEARAGALRTQLQGVKPVIITASTTAPNPNYQRLEAELASAKTDLAGALIQWEDGAPVIRELKARVQRIENQMASMQKTIGSAQQQSPNPVYQSLTTELAQATSLAAAAAQRYQAAESSATAHRTALSKLPDVQRKLAALTRQQDSLARVAQDYQARLTAQEAAQRARLTTASIISPAFAYPNPVSPSYPLNLGGGLIAGLLLGILSAFSTESRRSPIRTLTQLNRLTLEPAFRTIPELPFVPLGINRQPDEVFVTLLGNFVRSTKRPYRIGVLGVDPDTGATVAATSIALGASLEGHPTLVVDTARDGGVARRLGVSETERLVNANPELTLFRTGGEEGAQPHAIAEQIRELEEPRSLTVIDLNPFKANNNPVLYLAGLDECVLLVRAGRTRTVDFLQAQQMLIDAGVPQVTVVLARAKTVDDDFTFLPAETQPQALMSR
jgi:uncharacterized protein involved in exopolysaccharide biosynthesis